MAKTIQPKKRAYKKRIPKYIASTNVVITHIKDELDLMRDMFASFESMAEEGRFRAYKYFTDKYERYESKPF